MLENEKIVETRPVGYVHEARKSFKTIKEAIEATCGNSYSLGESDIGIFLSISSIEEAQDAIDKYYKAEEGRYNLPYIRTLFTYDDLEDGMIVSNNDTERLPNSICYETSTGTNQLLIREGVDDKGNSLYTAIYRVESKNLLQQSSAMQAFSKDGWDCRCREADIEEHHKVGNILNTDNLVDDGIGISVDAAYMFDSELSPEVIEEIEALRNVDVSDQKIRFREANEGEMIRHVLEKFGKVTQLERVVFGDGQYAYKLPDEITGTIFEGYVGPRQGLVYIDEINIGLGKIEPVARSYEWYEIRPESPPSEELLRAMDEEARKSGIELWTDTDKQLAITEKIKAESGGPKEITRDKWIGKKMHTPQDIAKGISPRQGEMDEALKETIAEVKSKEVIINQEGKTLADE